MIQLWAWEHENEKWVGFEQDGVLRGSSESGWQGTLRSKVTNLRKVKVVDEDAITISKAEVDEITSMTIQTKPQSCAEEAIGFYRAKDTILRILRHSVVTEPKNFGAIVEAECRFIIDGKSRFQFVRHADGSWYANVANTNNTRQVWSDLINPTIISEGVE